MIRKNIFITDRTSFGKLLVKRGNFLSQVYLLLSLQLAITTLVVWFARKYDRIHKYFWLWFVLSLIAVFVLVSYHLPLPVKFGLFTVLSILLGMNLLAASKVVPEQIIKSAILNTLVLFILMTLIGVGLASTGINLNFMGFTLFIALCVMLVSWITASFVGVTKRATKGMLMVGIVLFCVYVAYDTNALMLDDTRGVVEGALGLYLDFINMFSNILGWDMN